jgi:cytochrome d ubiquinol oxidase subunit II
VSAGLSMDLQTVWFLLVGVLFAGYAVLDGMDLGVGVLHLLARTDDHRRVLLNAIGPVWDGNEVWLITGGGALFAAFPAVYATVFSGFYLAMVLLLLALILRAVSIEFRGLGAGRAWRTTWDVGFAVVSVLAAFVIGVALGNVAWGIPLDSGQSFAGTFASLFHPYALLVGVTTVALFAVHGGNYLLVKTEGQLHDQVRRWVWPAIWCFLAALAVTTAVTFLYAPHLTAAVRSAPAVMLVALATLLAVAEVPREVHAGHHFRAWLASGAVTVGLLALVGLDLYPVMVLNARDLASSLTAYNASSSPQTLRIMLVIAGVGMPLVVAYTAAVYWLFRGKVKIDRTSY